MIGALPMAPSSVDHRLRIQIPRTLAIISAAENLKMSRNERIALVASLVVFPALLHPAHTEAHARAEGPISVTVIVPEEYPAFDPEVARQAGVETRVPRFLVLRNAPWSDREVGVIVNPEHATPRILAAAMLALRRQMEVERATGSESVGIGILVGERGATEPRPRA